MLSNNIKYTFELRSLGDWLQDRDSTTQIFEVKEKASDVKVRGFFVLDNPERIEHHATYFSNSNREETNLNCYGCYRGKKTDVIDKILAIRFKIKKGIVYLIRKYQSCGSTLTSGRVWSYLKSSSAIVGISNNSIT